MPRLRVLSTRVHGTLDYVLGLGLLLFPWIFGFAAVGGAATWVPITLGVAIIIYSLGTDHEWGMLRVVPMGYHVALDLFGGIFLSLSPWIFGFADEETNAWLPHVTLGLVLILVYFVSRTSSAKPAD